MQSLAGKNIRILKDNPFAAHDVASAAAEGCSQVVGPISECLGAGHLLNRLPRAERDELVSLMQPVECEPRDVLVLEGQPIQTVYFPQTAVLTVLAMGANMRPIEVAMIGCEGMTDRAHFHGDCAPLRTIVLVGGRMHQIGADTLLSFAQRAPAVQAMMAHYRETLAVQFSFAALAHGTMTIEARLARFILMLHDRWQGEVIPIVHNLIADVLAVRRSGVTTALHVLEGMGAIKSVRGRIILRDRARLLEVAAGSYGVAEREYRRLMTRVTIGASGP